MKVVVAPNSFKGSLSATQAAAAIARGVREAMPEATVIEVPLADGGEGTAEALVTANRGTYQWVNVEGPLGDPVLASYGLIDDAMTAVMEMASASGFSLVNHARRDVKKASTYGFGQLLDAARRAGVKSIIAGIGGSATNDCGAGMAQALGVLLLDASGRVLGGALKDPGGARDVTDAVAAYLAGVSQEAARTAKLLTLGGWTALAAEGKQGHVHLTALAGDVLLLVVRDRSVPMGRLAVIAQRAAGAARRWLEQQR